MSKTLLIVFACVVLTVCGQEELRKERDAAQQTLPFSTQPSHISKGESEKETLEREKRMPDAKKQDDGSFGYAWNVGSGVSYMKMHIGKTNNPTGPDSYAAAQHKVGNSLRNDGHGPFKTQNDKTGYEKLHKDYLKMSQQIMSQKNKNLNAKPTIENQKTLGEGKQEFNFKDKNSARFSFNNEENKEIKEAQNKFYDFNTKLKQGYDKFNKHTQFSGWPDLQAKSLKELNIAENVKSLQAKGEYESSTESEPGFENNNEFLKNLHHQQNFAFGGNLDGVFKSIELPMQESTFGTSNHFINGRETIINGFNPDENVKEFREQTEESRPSITIPLNFKNDHSLASGGENDAVFKYIGDTVYKTESGEGKAIPNTFHESQGEAWSSQNVVSNHQSSVEDNEQNQIQEETRKTTDGENFQKDVSEISYTPQTVTENKESQFHEIKEENVNPQIANGFGSRFVSAIHPEMNQKLINDQVERIKQMQQKVIENHFPGADIYDILDGNTQHGFSMHEHPTKKQKNTGLWKQEEYNKEREQSNTRQAHVLYNNHEVMNNNYHKERPASIGGTGSLSYSNVRFGHSMGDLKRHNPFMNNNAQSPKFTQNQFYERQKYANDERTRGTENHERVKETLWRPQRYSIKSNNQYRTDLQMDTQEPDKLDNESLKEKDERKGREIKSSFENEGSVHFEHKEIPTIDEHTKDHFHASEEFKEEKTSYPENGYHQFHKYQHQEPQVKVITKAVPVHKELKIPVPQMVRHPILIPFPVKVLEPYPIKIPYPVTVEKTVEVPVEKVIHYPVEKLVPKKVVKEVRVPVPKPYPVKVPVYKIKYVHHNKKKHQ